MEMEILVEDKLDETWIKDFEKIDNTYSEFYKSDIYFVKITCIYIDKENEILKIKEELFFMKNPNIISREELVGILKKNSFLNNICFSLLSLLRYNLNIEPEDITYVNNKNYMSILKNIDEIVFDKTINMFHHLNNIIIIYYEKISNNLNNSELNDNLNSYQLNINPNNNPNYNPNYNLNNKPNSNPNNNLKNNPNNNNKQNNNDTLF
jgi:hypothetical protein